LIVPNVALLSGERGLMKSAVRPNQRTVLVNPFQAVSVPVRSFDGESIGSETLNLRTTKTGKDMYVVHRKYIKERRDARAGTASTLTRGEVRGGGRKPYKQKGSGNARRGSTRSPLIVGGGVTHGPKPKNWANKKMNRKEAELAISIAIQNKAIANDAVVVDSLVGKLSAPPKTKAVVDLLTKLDLDPSLNTILVIDEYDELLDKSQNNLPKLELRLQDEISVSDMLWAKNVVFSKPAFDWVNSHYGASSSTSD